MIVLIKQLKPAEGGEFFDLEAIDYATPPTDLRQLLQQGIGGADQYVIQASLADGSTYDTTTAWTAQISIDGQNWYDYPDPFATLTGQGITLPTEIPRASFLRWALSTKNTSSAKARLTLLLWKGF